MSRHGKPSRYPPFYIMALVLWVPLLSFGGCNLIAGNFYEIYMDRLLWLNNVTSAIMLISFLAGLVLWGTRGSGGRG